MGNNMEAKECLLMCTAHFHPVFRWHAGGEPRGLTCAGSGPRGGLRGPPGGEGGVHRTHGTQRRSATWSRKALPRRNPWGWSGAQGAFRDRPGGNGGVGSTASATSIVGRGAGGWAVTARGGTLQGDPHAAEKQAARVLPGGGGKLYTETHDNSEAAMTRRSPSRRCLLTLTDALFAV